MTYLFVAPQNGLVPGFKMGAIGLGLKNLLLMIGISIFQMHLITKKISLSLRRLLVKQIYIVLILYGLLIMTRAFIQIMSLSPLPHLFGIFAIYLALTFLLVYAKPEIVGMTVHERNDYKRQFEKKCKDFFIKRL